MPSLPANGARTLFLGDDRPDVIHLRVGLLQVGVGRVELRLGNASAGDEVLRAIEGDARQFGGGLRGAQLRLLDFNVELHQLIAGFHHRARLELDLAHDSLGLRR